MSPPLGEDDSMALLSDVVAACDEAAEHHGVEKVRTIGSSYLAVSGLSVERPDHTARMVEFAREVVRIVKRFNAERGVRLVPRLHQRRAGDRRPDRAAQVHLRPLGRHGEGGAEIESDGRTSILVTRPVYERVRELVVFGAADAGRGSAASDRSSSSLCSTRRPRYERTADSRRGAVAVRARARHRLPAGARRAHRGGVRAGAGRASRRRIGTVHPQLGVPLAGLVIFLRWVVLLPSHRPRVRSTESACWAVAIVAIIGVVNNVVFESAAAGTWQRKVPRLLRDLLRLLLVAIGLAPIYSFVWGREIEGALAALGVTSIVVGLALQEPLGISSLA